MTVYDVLEKYQIPYEVLNEYHDWGLCGDVYVEMKDWQYNDNDLEKIRMIMTLHDIGFDNKEVEIYIKLFIREDNSQKQRMEMLNNLRNKILDEIHLKEYQIMRMDYLRKEIMDYEINKNKIYE